MKHVELRLTATVDGKEIQGADVISFDAETVEDLNQLAAQGLREVADSFENGGKDGQ